MLMRSNWEFTTAERRESASRFTRAPVTSMAGFSPELNQSWRALLQITIRICKSEWRNKAASMAGGPYQRSNSINGWPLWNTVDRATGNHEPENDNETPRAPKWPRVLREGCRTCVPIPSVRFLCHHARPSHTTEAHTEVINQCVTICYSS